MSDTESNARESREPGGSIQVKASAANPGTVGLYMRLPVAVFREIIQADAESNVVNMQVGLECSPVAVQNIALEMLDCAGSLLQLERESKRATYETPLSPAILASLNDNEGGGAPLGQAELGASGRAESSALGTDGVPTEGTGWREASAQGDTSVYDTPAEAASWARACGVRGYLVTSLRLFKRLYFAVLSDEGINLSLTIGQQTRRRLWNAGESLDIVMTVISRSEAQT